MAEATINELITMFSNRIEALESRHAFQDDLIDQLSSELAVHQTKIADLKDQLALVSGRLKDMGTGNMANIEDETPPPHY